MPYPYTSFYNPYQGYSQPMQNYNQPMQQQQPVQAQQQQPTIQQGGFVRVQNEQEARQYPLAPGYSMTFIDDSANYCYVKTMGFSQFDKPKFEKFRLVKEEDAPVQTAESPAVEYALKSELDALKKQVDEMQTVLKDFTEPVAIGKDVKDDA